MARRRVIITGGAGRIGQLLQREWAGKTNFDSVFLTRSDWDILAENAPALSKNDIVLDLAGTIRGDVSKNPELASRVAAWAEQATAPHFYMSSASVYSGGQGQMLETDVLAPASDYGRSKVQAEIATRLACPTSTILRLGNVAGLDALLGGLDPSRCAILDPVHGQEGGPIRSYIGPKTLAQTLSNLIGMVIDGADLPSIMNLAQPNPVSMADLLNASGHDWNFGPERAGVIPRVVLSTARLTSICFVPTASADQLVAEVKEVKTSP